MDPLQRKPKVRGSFAEAFGDGTGYPPLGINKLRRGLMQISHAEDPMLRVVPLRRYQHSAGKDGQTNSGRPEDPGRRPTLQPSRFHLRVQPYPSRRIDAVRKHRTKSLEPPARIELATF